MTQKTVLLVEDDYLNKRLTKKTLLKSGYRVLESKNTNEALHLIKFEQIDVVILDINLGNDKLEGIILGQKIKDLYQIPFIYLTAYANIPTLTKATTTKPHSYLTKPLKEIDLIASIEIAIGQTTALQVKLISSISVKLQDHFVDLALDSIDYIEANGNYLLCFSAEKVYRYRSTIKQLLALPSKVVFVQIHRGFLINRSKIERYNAKNVSVNKKNITVSRNYKKNLFLKP